MNYFDLLPNDRKSVPAMGYFDPEFIIVGKAPGTTFKKEPISYRSIMLMKKYLDGHKAYFTNLIKVPKPQSEKAKKAELTFYVPLLIDELKDMIGPNTRILTLGADPARVLCPGFSSLREDHGTLFFNPDLNCHVVPTFVFSAGARNPDIRRFIDSDLERFYNVQEIIDSAPYRIVTSDQLEINSEKVFIDIETDGLDPFTNNIISVGIIGEGDTEVQIITAPFSDEDHSRLFETLNGHTLIGHNLQFDLAFLERKIAGWTFQSVEDTMIMAAVIGEPVLSLKHLVTQYTQRPGSHSGGSFEDPQYLAEDVFGTHDVYQHFDPRTKSLYAVKLLNSLVPHFVRMRSFGVHIDWEKHESLVKEYLDLIEQAMASLKDITFDLTLKKHLKKNPSDDTDEYRSELTQKVEVLNWNSPLQVAPVLKALGVPLHTKTNTGHYSVSEPVLREFQGKHQLVDALLTHRDIVKESSFLVSYRDFGKFDGYLHPRLSLTGTQTGRLSCSDPNLQQVPRVGPIKLLFRSRFREGYIGLIDLAQAELRVAALLSNDDLFTEALLRDDVHRFIASKIYQLPEEEISPFQRKKSKGVTFGLLYGGSPTGLAERVGVEESEVRKIVKDFFGLFPKLGQYIEDQKLLTINTGESSTVLGRIRRLDAIIEMEGEHSAERKGINTPIQGTASDIMLVIMNHVFREVSWRKLYSHPIFGVHDSSLHDVHPDETELMARIVNEGFQSLNDTPLKKLPLWNTLPITGELILGKTWAAVESTNEENYDPSFRYPCSNLR